MSHLMGCLFHFIAMEETNNGVDNTWLHANDLLDEEFWKRYVYSIYVRHLNKVQYNFKLIF